MSATHSEALATAERELEVDAKAAADVLLMKMKELSAHNAAILKIARPLLRELIVGYAAMLQTVQEDTALDLSTLLGAVAMAMGDPPLQMTMSARIARARSVVTTEAMRQAAATPKEPDEEPTGRMN